jgi:trichothecene 3-O-acetyltransferase
MEDQARYQDVIGQFPLLKTYNHGIFFFPLRDETSRESVVKALETATVKVTSKIPWLADQVVNEGKGPGNSGTFKLAPWPSSAQLNTIVRVKDCSDVCPPYAEIIKARGPISMLDGNILCPYPGFPLSYEESEIGPAPVVAIQANFIKGGLLLNFSNQHNIMDASALFMFIMLLAAAMRSEEFPDRAIEQGNRDRKTVVPLLGPDEPIRDHNHLRRPPPSKTPQPPAAPQSPASWCYFRFFGKNIPKIKALAADPEGFDSSVPFISSNDALCAFCWKRLAAARLRNGRDPDAMSKFSRAIDARTAMGVPMEYMGQMVYHSATRLSLKELVDLPLSAIASRMRKDLNDVNNDFSVRSYVTFLAGVPDKSTLAYGGPFNPDTDIGSSSMAQLSALPNFGVLGAPELIRRPNLAPIPGCLYFYPPEGGDLPVLVCLNKEDLKALRADPEWSLCTEFIG